jgi:hypothetical protein
VSHPVSAWARLCPQREFTVRTKMGRERRRSGKSWLLLLVLLGGCLQRPVAETHPATSNVFVEQFRQNAVNKIDLLFMIDNSASMGDKQGILAKAVPELLGRLLVPDCLEPSGVRHKFEAVQVGGECPAPMTRDFDPVKDVHIGVISSSLGGRGGDSCTPAYAPGQPFSAAKMDMGHLMGTVRTGIDPGLGGLGRPGHSCAREFHSTSRLGERFQGHGDGSWRGRLRL